VTHCTSLDCLLVTERGLQVRPGYSSGGGGSENTAGDAPQLREHDLVVELAGEWTVGICTEEWTALAASLSAQHIKQIVLLR
jgi:hypothetical protein